MGKKTNTLVDKIEKDKRLDHFIKRICFGSWGMLLLITVVYTLMMINQWMVRFGEGFRLLAIEQTYDSWAEVILTITVPFIGPFIIFLFSGILSTVAILVRMRTSSLRDIQLRLGTLESALLSDEE